MLGSLQRPKTLHLLTRLSHSLSPPPSRRRPDEQPLAAAAEVKPVHPWPEWVALLDRLREKKYLKKSIGTGSENPSKDANHIRTACLNFARDRTDLIRYFSSKDIGIVVGSGCPSLDRKVVNSGKRLRSHVGIDEAEVCTPCNLRSRCDRAYVKAQGDGGGRTVDVIRILLTYGLDVVTGTLENQSCMTETVKESVKKLLNEVVVFSVKEPDSNNLGDASESSSGHRRPKRGNIIPMKQGDWMCPKCDFMNFARNINCYSCNGRFGDRIRKLHEGRTYLPLKGDWICENCDFFNFAKNTKCLQCLVRPSKRDLGPGEWECLSCNYINFRKNMVCLKCDWKRPRASASGNIVAETQYQTHGRDKHPGSRDIWNNGQTEGNRFSHQCRLSSEEDDGLWSSDEERAKKVVRKSHKFDKFDDFPLVGGKSVTSQDPVARESWKEAMLRNNNGVSDGECENNDQLSFAKFCTKETDKDSDDDEIAGWFK